MKKIEDHGICYVCGSSNPHGIGLSWYSDEKNTIYSEFFLNASQQGPPGYAHGGASAAILDEAMGVAIWRSGFNVAVVNLEINYKRPLPLGQKLKLEARFIKREERKIFASGEIRLNDGIIAVNGTGIYIEAPHLFEPGRYRDM
ncbi:MAG: PaaI family thioesterase [Chloroflexota bacterium]